MKGSLINEVITMFHFVITVDDIIGAAALLFIIGVIIFCKVCDWQNEHRSKKEQKNKDKKFREE